MEGFGDPVESHGRLGYSDRDHAGGGTVIPFSTDHVNSDFVDVYLVVP